MLVHLEKALANQFECRSKTRGENRRLVRRLDHIIEEILIETAPVDRLAEQPLERLARLGERPHRALGYAHIGACLFLPLAGIGFSEYGLQAAIERGMRWLAGMQSKDGGWGAFDADNTRKLVEKLPFCDFGEVIDPPSADVTAHVVEAFAAEGRTGSLTVRRGVVWLLRAQEPDGSWFGRWGANYVYGIGAAVPALIAAGVKPSKPAIRRAVAWLENHHNPDGGWGEDLRSYDDPALAGHGESTASQTAWALLALLAAGEHRGTAAERGIRWLARTQRADGSWDQPQYTGTGFPGDVYINYHLYRLAFPISALGRYVGLTHAEVAHDGDDPAS